tara:strand:- start:196 stop:1059 length:864 start_codon:yes stop_codon:yes gene_type:complete
MISYDVFLLVNSHNEYTMNSIKAFKNAKTNSSIKKYISSTENHLLPTLEDKNIKGIDIIKHKVSFKSLFDHMRWLTNFSNADYISFLHDDDMFSDDLLIIYHQYLTKFLPVAFTARSNLIDQNSILLKKVKQKKNNRIIKLNPSKIINRYFLPFDKPVVLPATAFDRKIFKDYWSIFNLRNLSIFEDVRIIFFFSQMGLFLESQNSNLYLYRINIYQTSQIRIEFNRLRLINWLRNLEISLIHKLLLIYSSKIQYFLFYKREYFSSKKITKIFIKIRNKIINLRIGR